MQFQDFAERHPFQVVDAAGETVARFSNVGAAMNFAKWTAHDRGQGFDVVANGLRVARCEPPARKLTASASESPS